MKPWPKCKKPCCVAGLHLFVSSKTFLSLGQEMNPQQRSELQILFAFFQVTVSLLGRN
jgi:hypothetical protein